MEAIEGTLEETKERWIKFSEVDNHGLVAQRPDGSVASTIPGHKFGEAELVAKVEALLQ